MNFEVSEHFQTNQQRTKLKLGKRTNFGTLPDKHLVKFHYKDSQGGFCRRSWPRYAIWHYRTYLTLVQLVVYRLFGIKPCWHELTHMNKFQWHFNHNTITAFRETVCKILSAKCRLLYSCLNLSIHDIKFIFVHVLLTWYVTLCIVYAPGMPETISPPPTSKKTAS